MLRRLVPALLLLVAVATPAPAQDAEPRLLVFSKAVGYRHASIEPGIAAIRRLGQESGFAVEATEDAGAFTERNLRRFRAVVFLNTSGDVLDARQQDAFERYIQAGGGWVGVHAATDTEYEWPWYGRLAGAYFESHPNDPNVRPGTFLVVDTTHVSTRGLPTRWEREDEFYSFKQMSPEIRVLVELADSVPHPMSWYQEYDGGRAFYTNMGHTEATYAEPLFLRHLLGGIRWAMGTGALDYSRARPEENRFTKVVLAETLNEPVELAVLPDERVLFIERRGAVNLYTPATGTHTRIATIPVSTMYLNGKQAEDGLLGLAADPQFATNGWIYLYYSPAGSEPKNVLARYTMRGDSLDLASAKVILEVPVQRDECCHTGGSIAFDAQGNLYLSTGDNTNPFGTGYAPIDERPGRSPWDAQKSSANTNDLRGKILRIRPQPDGSYTIPDGNLFPESGLTPRTRPEIYTMGHRNPYRIAVDQRTGFVYWGDVGPDASVDSVGRGPAGHDEIGQARRAGNFGWPYFVGDNKAYWDVDFATMQPGERYDPARPINRSPNNTGLNELPAAQPAFIWYPYGPSAEFPLLGTGGRTAMAGPVYYRDDFRHAARPFPAYYDGTLFIYEWMRGWIIAVTMDADGDYVSMERFMASHKFANPIDMQFGPNGDLYVLEYGTRWFQGNDDARLVRIEYNAGNRAPVVASVNKQGARDTATVDIAAGNEPPRVAIDITGNRSFFFPGVPVRYAVRVTDREDGRPATGVTVTAEHLKEPPAASVAVPDPHAAARQLVESGTCLSCHQLDRSSIGPSFTAVARKYTGDANARAYLAGKIRAGGSGVWGAVMMPPHPQLTAEQASRIAAYVLSLAEERAPSLPMRGSYAPPDSARDGVVVLRAAYTDRGANGAPPAAAMQRIVLRAPILVVANADTVDGVQKLQPEGVPVEITIGTRNGAFAVFRQLDLTGVASITFSALAPVPQANSAGGKVEVRIDSATGPLIGETTVLQPQATLGPPTMLRAPLRPTRGVHDVYFVFRNDAAPAGQNLLILRTATFESGAPPT